MAFENKPYTNKTWSETMADLAITFERWEIAREDWTVDAGIRPHRAAKDKQTEIERTVTLSYLTPAGNNLELTINKWPRAVDNLRALYLTVESLRLNEYRGIAEAVRAAYAQLPPPKVERDPYEVLGVHPRSSLEHIEGIYKMLVKRRHPDQGGTRAEWDELQAAIERIRRERQT